MITPYVKPDSLSIQINSDCNAIVLLFFTASAMISAYTIAVSGSSSIQVLSADSVIAKS